MPAIPFIADQSASQADRSLHHSLTAMDEAKQCSVLWFADIMRRHLYRDLGYSSINQYAMKRLKFSRSRTRDFVHLAHKLEHLPAVREAVTSGKLGYTKARELIKVATPETEGRWLDAAKGTREELITEVKRVKREARVDPGQGALLPMPTLVVAPSELPVHFGVELTPEQETRRAALVERLHKLGGVPPERAELLLEALAALVEMKESRGPRGPLDSRPPVQIHVIEDKATGRMTVPTINGVREIGRADAERLRCDAAVCEHGGRNSTTIAPRVRRRVLARDHHQCQAPGCGRTQFLEVHHVEPRRSGGSNQPSNLITLCSSCHRLWHERPTVRPAAPAPDSPHLRQSPDPAPPFPVERTGTPVHASESRSDRIPGPWSLL